MEYLFSRRVSILPSGASWTSARERKRQTSYPLANSSRKKDRRYAIFCIRNDVELIVVKMASCFEVLEGLDTWKYVA